MNQNIPPRYLNFKKWITLNGCKIDPRIEVPSIQSGVIGVSAKSQIQHSKIIMAIPQKLIITVQKCYQGQLKQLYKANDQLFDYEDSDDAQFNILALFIMYQKGKIIKGRRQFPDQQFYTFWQPYIQSVTLAQTGMDWTDHQLEGLPGNIKEQIIYFKNQIETLSKKVVQFIQNRPQFEGLTKQELFDLFNYSYKFIMTRCFGYCTPGTSLIPLADLMNHKCQGIDHQLINLQKQKGKLSQKYQIQSGKLDMTLLDNDLKRTQQNNDPIIQFLLSNYPNISQKQILSIDRKNRVQLVNKVYKSQLAEKKIYDMNFFSQSDNQDNDTDSDEKQKRKAQMDMIGLQQKQQMQIFRQTYKKTRVVSYQEVKKTLQFIQQTEKDIEKIESLNKPQTVQEISQKKQINLSSLNTTVTQNSPNIPNISKEEIIKKNNLSQKNQKNTKKKLNFKDQQSNQQDSNQQQQQQSEDDQEFPWFKDQGTYFTISTDKIVKQNQPLYNCYGRRTNRFLLIWYGFTYSNNLYDSVTFRFYINFNYQKDLNNLLFEHYYGGRGLIKGFTKGNLNIKSNEVSRQFRLKSSRIDRNLLIFLRLFLMNQYKGEDLVKIFGTFASSVEYELFVFEYLRKIIQKLLQRYPQQKIQKWKKQQQNMRIRFKIIFFEDQIKILNDNLQMIRSIENILVNLRNKQRCMNEIIKQYSFQMLRKIRHYIKDIQQNIDYIYYQGQQEQQQARQQ